MSSPAKLKLISAPQFSRSEVELWDPSSHITAHSLYSLIHYPHSFRPELAEHFINKYSAKSDIVLDPFCAGGNVGLAAGLMGRVPYCCGEDPMSLCIASAKLNPADITKVTLFMQKINLKQPVSIDNSLKDLLEFYDLETLRELLNLRKYLLKSYDQDSRFVEMIASSLLHGNNASFFSTYTNPQISLSVEEQKRLNIERRQSPEYRALLSRILKKTAQVTVDGVPDILEKTAELAVLKLTDPRNLSFLKSEKVDFILGTLPNPDIRNSASHFWLKHWFSDIDCSDYFANQKRFSNLEDWLLYINEILMEMARVLPAGRYAAFHIPDIVRDARTVDVSEEVHAMVARDLAFYWDAVEIVSNKTKSVQLRNAIRGRASSQRSLNDRVLVLRRR